MSIEILSEYIKDSFAIFNGFWLFGNVYSLYPFIKRSKNEEEEEKNINEPKISVLVPAYREEDVIIDNVNRIEKADYSKLELILITEKDDFKTDRMSEYLSKKYKNVKHVSIEGNKNRGKPRALNAGLRHADGEIVGVLDSEDYIDKELFKKVAYEFSRYGYDAVQGKLRLKESHNKWLDHQFAAEYRYWYGNYMDKLNNSSYILPFGGTTNFFKKSTIDELNGWENGNLTEDYELAIRMYGKQKMGKKYKVGYIDTVTTEETPKDIKSWIKQRTRWSQGKLDTTLEYIKKKDLDKRSKLKILATGLSSVIGTVNLVGVGISAYMYASGTNMGYFAGLAYTNLCFVGAYCYLQGRAYYEILKEKDEKHKYLKSAFIGATTPIYWALQWAANTIALGREIKGKKNWEKTMHLGTAFKTDNEQESEIQR
ncbi:glycosyltransferase [Candidatus Parvarchaeota archaeon]|nr:glycosyltransferase [Candidatus Parvarchaeota archaeon]